MKTYALLWVSAALANPLRLSLNFDIELPEQSRPVKQALSTDSGSAADELPIVELPYEKHKASPDLTKDQKYYNFSNIPYAQQPIGDLRFKAAESIEAISGNLPLNDGQKSVICPQAQVGWYSYAEEFVRDFYSSKDDELEKWKYPIVAGKNYSWSDKVPALPNIDESCLTLDVVVPKRIYDKRNDNDGWDAPVLVWFFGGGYVFGSKTLFGSPAGLLKAATQREDVQEEDVIVVAVNYRLGAFGWLAGDTFEKEGGFENAGLSDQVAALQWVQDNIRKFGGDSSKVTVVGQSAGASSILHHLTAYGGPRLGRHNSPPKFQRAILQSPALFPVVDRSKMEDVYQKFLKETGASNFTDLVSKDTQTLIRANSKTSYESPYGQFNYGPVVDDTYVKAPPHLLLKYGFIWPSDIIVSYNRAEGLLFTPPWVRTKGALREHILSAYPRFFNESLDELVDKIYLYEAGASGKKAINVTGQVLGDFGIVSNVYGLTRKYPEGYEYQFNFFPGVHGQDAHYTFYPTGDVSVNAEQAQRLQRYLTSFVKWRDVNVAKFENDTDWDPRYFDGKRMTFGSVKVPPSTDSAYGLEPDTLDETRGEYWLSAGYWNPSDEFETLLKVQSNADSHSHSFEMDL